MYNNVAHYGHPNGTPNTTIKHTTASPLSNINFPGNDEFVNILTVHN